ncbi:MAG: phosphatase [Acidimicrobiia bacterium]
MRWERQPPASARPVPTMVNGHLVRPRSLRRQLLDSRGAGTVPGLTFAELERVERQLLIGDHRALLGMSRPHIADADELVALRMSVWGLHRREGRVWLDPMAALGAARLAGNLIREVARAGGRVAFATGSPASMLTLYQALAFEAFSHGATVPEGTSEDLEMEGHPTDAHLAWINGVAVLSRAGSLLSTTDPLLAKELIFTCGKPDLFVGDRAFAAVMIGEGVRTIAVAPPTEPIFGVTHRRTGKTTVIPVVGNMPAPAYLPLVAAATQHVDAPSLSDAAKAAMKTAPNRDNLDSWKKGVRPLK